MLQRYNVEFNTPNIFVIIFALRNIFNATAESTSKCKITKRV